jgi:predicted CxxxxCH...CXXCH cytochrome family protein
MAATTSSGSCVTCHGDVTGYSSDHRNGQISMAANINTSPNPATYSNKGLFFNQTSVPVLGGCSNVNCHFEATTPMWGSAPADTTCSTCHLAQPSTGSHTAHETWYGGTASCIKCHAARTTFQHATSAGNIGRTIDLTSLAGSYTGSNFNYLPSQSGTRTLGTCASLYCHSSGQGTTATDATPVYAATAPTWGGTAACGSCHATTAMASGSHTNHLAFDTNCGNCHTGAAAAAYNNAVHVNQLIDVAGSYTKGGAPGNGYGTCSTASCHGSNSPAWGANTDNASCTKCHGKPTVLANYSSANAWQAAPGYATTGTDINGQTGAFTNGVSNDQQVGAHDAHLRAINGYTDRKVLCTDCHSIPGTANHANGTINYVWSDQAKNVGTVGSVSTRGTLTPSYDGTSCSTNYCHGGVLNGGTDTTPAWNDTAYLTTYSKDATNCGKCHGAPPTSGATLGYDHNGITIATACTGCHGHEGSGATHIDGNLQAAGGACDSCHSYDTVGGVWGSGSHKDGATAEGWGAHARHIDHLKTLKGITLNAGTDTYGSANFNAICGVCHTQVPGDHSLDNSTARMINFNGDLLTYKFGPNNPIYNGVSGTPSSTTAKTCSNISCHTGLTPRWQ